MLYKDSICAAKLIKVFVNKCFLYLQLANFSKDFPDIWAKLVQNL